MYFINEQWTAFSIFSVIYMNFTDTQNYLGKKKKKKKRFDFLKRIWALYLQVVMADVKQALQPPDAKPNSQ